MILSPRCLCLGLIYFCSSASVKILSRFCFDELRNEAGHIVCLSKVLDEGYLTSLAMSTRLPSGWTWPDCQNQPEVGSPLAPLHRSKPRS